MVVTLAFSTKVALTFGAVVGGTVAVMANKDKILEVFAELFEKGADFCNEHIEKNKIQMAAHLNDGEFDFDRERPEERAHPEEAARRQRSEETDETDDNESDPSGPENSETEGILTDDWDMDGWQLAHLSESDFTESYDEIDSELVSRVTSSGEATRRTSRVSEGSSSSYVRM